MKICLQLAILAVCLMFPCGARASAWPQTKGETQVIVSSEAGSADSGFDISGDRSITLDQWRQNNLSVFVDHGLTRRLTLTAKVNYRDYTTGMASFSGLSSIEAGGRWTLKRTDNSVFALGATVEGFGSGKRNDYDVTAKGGTDYDLRAYAGKSFKLLGRPAFMDLQGARHLRQYEANEWRIDATLGIKPSPKWMLMAQVFAGRTDKADWGYAAWTNTELSVVRNFGPHRQTSVQLGLRQTLAGRNIPAVHAVIASIWKTF